MPYIAMHYQEYQSLMIDDRYEALFYFSLKSSRYGEDILISPTYHTDYRAEFRDVVHLFQLLGDDYDSGWAYIRPEYIGSYIRFRRLGRLPIEFSYDEFTQMIDTLIKSSAVCTFERFNHGYRF